MSTQWGAVGSIDIPELVVSHTGITSAEAKIFYVVEGWRLTFAGCGIFGSEAVDN